MGEPFGVRGGFDEIAAAYKGLDELAGFENQAAVAAYRQLLRERSRQQADFIASRLSESCCALEIGCGNGRLLIELALRGAICGGLGLDLAQSRIDFAREWANSEQLTTLTFEAGDALSHPLTNEAFGSCMCVTGAFTYFDAAVPGAAQSLLRRLARALVPGGLLVLELYLHPRYRRLLEASGGELRLWRELPPEDPWRYYLSTLQLEGGILQHEKTFIHRQTGAIDQGRRERIRLYSLDEIRALLSEGGFERVSVFGGWDGRQYQEDESMILIAFSRGA